jgi:hypothetical protein
MIIDFPGRLQGVEFATLHFILEFQESFRLSPEVLLRLRRDLRRGGRRALDGEGERFAALFEPVLSPDPFSRRRHQRPGPPFALASEGVQAGDYEAGDRFELSVNFFGMGIQAAVDFGRALREHGRIGLFRGQGAFELSAIVAEDAAGERRRIWQEGDALQQLVPPMIDAAWRIEALASLGGVFRLRFVTPARILSQGRPLFRPSFARIFPFMLRRVTSMVHAHCGIELVDDPRPLLDAGARFPDRGDALAWKDWRSLQGVESEQDLGGVTGSLRLEGRECEEIFWVPALCSLMNLGKSAAWGGGHFHLEAGDP